MAKELNFFDLYGDNITQFKKEDKQEIVNVEEKKESVNITENEIVKTESLSNVQSSLENDKTNKVNSDLNSLLLQDALNAADTEFGEVEEIDNNVFSDDNNEGKEENIDNENDELDENDESDENDEDISADENNDDEPITNLLGEVVTTKDKTKNSSKSVANSKSTTPKKKTKNNKELMEDECKKYKKIIVKYSGIEIMVFEENQIKNINLNNIKESLITTYNFGELNDDLLWRVIPSREEGTAYLQPSNKMMPKG